MENLANKLHRAKRSESPRPSTNPKKGVASEAEGQEIVVSDEMLSAGMEALSLHANPYDGSCSLTLRALREIYISMRALDIQN
jgi:hypothetical protein